MLLFSKTLVVQLKSLDGGNYTYWHVQKRVLFYPKPFFPRLLFKKKIKPSFRVPAAKDIVVKFDLSVSSLYLVIHVLNTY